MGNMKQTPNTSTNMKLTFKVKASSLKGLLEHVNVNNSIDPVKVHFNEEGATIWAHDANKTLQIFIDDFALDDYELKSKAGNIVFESKRVAEILSAKFGNDTITVKADSGQPVSFTSKGSSMAYYPPSEDECFVVPDHWVLPVTDEGDIQYPMLEDAESTLRVSIHPDELKKALTDMRVANASYASIVFKDGDSVSESGHWANKSNTSKTDIEATVIRGEGSVTFPEVLGSVIDRLSGAADIQKHGETPFFIIGSGSTRILVTEAQRAGDQ
jgi:hypothetical protein